jgi:predicted ferric reductase
MKLTARRYAILTAVAIFVALPLLLYVLGDTPRRSLLKESLSILTLLALSLMLGQFFLARSNASLLSLFDPPQIQKLHKIIAYSAVGITLLHPALVVMPRYFEAGVKPWDAFVTMVTTFDSLGIVLGLAAWVLLLVLAITAYVRKPLIPRFTLRYRGWRYFHGALAVAFTALALWHAIELGRHTGTAMAAFYITLALAGVALLARLYWGTPPARPASPPAASGASK